VCFQDEDEGEEERTESDDDFIDNSPIEQTFDQYYAHCAICMELLPSGAAHQTCEACLELDY